MGLLPGRRKLALLGAVVIIGCGTIVGTWFGGPRWGITALIFGAATSALAPSALERWKRRADAHQSLRESSQLPVPSLKQSIAQLLDPRHQIVQFFGRSSELQDLVSWCESKDSLGVRLLTGPGGIGKTRLAIQLADVMREWSWTCRFLSEGGEKEALTAARNITSGPLLLVLDYAETRSDLNSFFRACALDDAGPLRVLLLARNKGDWWDRLGMGEPLVRSLLETGSKQSRLHNEIDPLLSPQKVAEQAIPAFAKVLKLTEPKALILIGLEDKPPSILQLHAAALVALLNAQDSESTTIEVRLDDVITEVLRHEAKYWYGHARTLGLVDGLEGITVRALHQSVAIASLLGASSEEELLKVLQRTPELQLSSDAVPRRMSQLVQNLYPPEEPDAVIGYLKPDLALEQLVTSELAASPDFLASAFQELNQGQSLRALTIMTRASFIHDDAQIILETAIRANLRGLLIPAMEVAIESGGLMGKVLARIFSDADIDLPQMIAFEDGISSRSVSLGEADIALTQRIIRELPDKGGTAVEAYWHHQLGGVFLAQNRWEEAIAAEQDAIDIYRSLVRKEPKRYRLKLGAALNNLAIALKESGNEDASRQAVEESLKIRRRLYKIDQERHAADLARTLATYAHIISDPVQAMQAVEESVELYKFLNTFASDVYLDEYALALSSLSHHLVASGRVDESLSMAQQVERIFEGLSETSPDQHLQTLAASKVNLSNRLSNAGREKEAVEVLHEAVDIYEALVAKGYERPIPDYIEALHRLSVRASQQGDFSDAYNIAIKSAALSRRDSSIAPPVLDALYGESLVFSSAALQDMMRFDESIQDAEMAVAVFRRLHASSRQRFARGLARAILKLSDSLAHAGQHPAALTAAREAVALYRDLRDTTDKLTLEEYAQSLINMGVILAEAVPGSDEAIAIEMEALAVFERMTSLAIAYNRGEHARVLENLSVSYSQVSNAQKAIELGEQAVSLSRELFRSDPKAHVSTLLRSLRNLAVRYTESGLVDDARRISSEMLRVINGVSASDR